MYDLIKSVLIQVDHSVFGSARCSGFQFENVIIANGSLLNHLFSNNFSCDGDSSSLNSILKDIQEIITELSKQQHFVHSENNNKENPPFKFKILSKNLPDLNTHKTGIRPNHSEHIQQKISAEEIYSSENAKLCLMHNYEVDGITNLFLNLGYTECQNNLFNRYNPIVIPFLFLMTGLPSKHAFEKTLHSLFTILKGIHIYPGLPIAVESTPFANLVFYNSLSQGIICKIFGPNLEGFLIDARLVFGCEGAPIFVFEGSKGPVVGIVVGMVSKCDIELIGFSMGLSLKHLLKSVLGLKANDYIPFSKLKPIYPASIVDIDHMASAVLFVRCQHKWGSGVVVDANMGLVLTCSHTVYHAQDSVYVIYKGKKYQAYVEYASPPLEPYDLALLSVEKIPGLKQLEMTDEAPVVGEPVITVGYALSNESSVIADGTPTLSRGCVSKVSCRGGPLQTTCCTQSGVSGGAVLRPPDQLIGIVVSNIRLGPSVLPFFSFAISVVDFKTAIIQFRKTKDPTFLRSLTVRSPDVKMKWTLQESKL